MFDGLFQPTHLLVFAVCIGGLWLLVRTVRNAWKKS